MSIGLGQHNIAISLRDVSVCYRSRPRLFGSARDKRCVVRGVSMDIHHGDSLGVLGCNGAGKSTILKLLGGLIEPDAGQVEQYVDTISLLSIQAGFIPYLSGRHNAILGGLLIGMSREQVNARLDDIREFSGLGDYFEEPMNTYSAGMRSRLGFSTSINIDPDVLLIDEILAVGDASFKKKSRAMIQQRINEQRTIVFVSHSTTLIRECCNRAIWVEDGKIVMQGEVDDVVDKYDRCTKAV